MPLEISVKLHRATCLPHVSFLFFFWLLLCFSFALFFRFSLNHPFIVFTLAASLTTVSPSSSLAPGCPGNQVMQENSTGCGCPSGMAKGDDDSCTCPMGFILESGAGCKGEEGQNQSQCFIEGATSNLGNKSNHSAF